MTVDRTQALHEVLARHDAASEAARHLAPESVAAMREAGLLRLLVPRRAGGDERDLQAMAETVIDVARSSPAAAWVLMVSTAHDLVVGGFPEAAQDEVWAAGPDDVFPGSLATAGTLTPVDGGWLLSGRWPFASGAVHGRWFLLGSAERHEDKVVPHHVVVPRADLRLDDEWHTLGLRGTGSVNAHAEGAFVPTHRGINTGQLFRARSPWQARHASDLYKTPIVPALAAHLAATALGIAGPALDDVTGRARRQDDRYTLGRKIDRPGLQMRLAEADGELRCGRALLDDTIRLLQQAAAGEDTPALRARAKFQAAYVAEMAKRAVDRVMTASGARAAFDGSRVQQAFRDIAMAKGHAMIDLDGAAETYGRTLLGLNPGPVPL